MRGRRIVESLVLPAILVSISCSGGGPSLPKPGSPASYWASAKAAYKAGDFVKTDEELQRVMVTDNEFTARARAFDLILSAGLAKGYSDLADVYEAGAKANRQNPLPYRKRVSELRALAGNMSIQVADNVHKFLELDKDAQVALAFDPPAGSPNEPSGLERISHGLFVQDSETALIQTAMLQRGVVLTLASFTSNIANPVPRDAYLLAAAKALEQESDLFGSKKLDLPNKLKIVSQEALSALKAVPETKESKALTDKLQKAMKKANLT